ncbi:hypothetical protein ACWFR5_26810 [Streptomyces sp. NPDC055092]
MRMQSAPPRAALAVREGIDKFVAERKVAGNEVRRMDIELGLKRLVRYKPAA